MAIRIAIEAPADITTLDGLKIRVEVENIGGAAARIPATDDTSSALTFVVISQGGEVIRRINGISKQAMFSTSKVNYTCRLESIEPGEIWRWTFDAGRFHYTLPEGKYDIEAELRMPGSEAVTRSNRTPVMVSPCCVTGIHTSRDNPVIQRLSDIVSARQTDGSPVQFLRQFNPFRPLAPFFNERIPSLAGMTELHCAEANYFQTESFEPLTKTWLVWRKGDQVQAVLFQNGLTTGAARRATIPTGRELTGSTFYDRLDRLFVMMTGPEGPGGAGLECWELEGRALRPVIRHEFRTSNPRLIVVRADEEFLHVVYPRRGLVYRRFALSGESAEERRLVKSKRPMHACSIDAGRAMAMFWNPGKEREVELACARLEPGQAPIEKTVRMDLRKEVREVSFDCDKYGRFHVLAATGERLYYMRDGGSAELLAEGDGPFFPRVVAPASVYLGFHTREHGYRSVWFTRKPHHKRIVNFDMVGK